MSKISTDDCRKFLADFCTRNPSVVTAIFYSARKPLDAEQQQHCDSLARWAATPRLWKRSKKYKVHSDASYLSGDETVHIYDTDVSVQRSGYDGTREVPNTFIWARDFYLNEDELEGQVGFTVLEDAGGQLYLGPYCGD